MAASPGTLAGARPLAAARPTRIGRCRRRRTGRSTHNRQWQCAGLFVNPTGDADITCPPPDRHRRPGQDAEGLATDCTGIQGLPKAISQPSWSPLRSPTNLVEFHIPPLVKPAHPTLGPSPSALHNDITSLVIDLVGCCQWLGSCCRPSFESENRLLVRCIVKSRQYMTWQL